MKIITLKNFEYFLVAMLAACVVGIIILLSISGPENLEKEKKQRMIKCFNSGGVYFSISTYSGEAVCIWSSDFLSKGRLP